MAARKEGFIMTNCSIGWAAEIRQLASDFCIPRKDTEKIIKAIFDKGLSGDVAYTAAWKRLFDLM